MAVIRDQLHQTIIEINSNQSLLLKLSCEVGSMGTEGPEQGYNYDYLIRSFTSRIALNDNQYEVYLPWEGTSQHL